MIMILSCAQSFLAIDSSIIIMYPSSKLYFFRCEKLFMNCHRKHSITRPNIQRTMTTCIVYIVYIIYRYHDANCHLII